MLNDARGTGAYVPQVDDGRRGELMPDANQNEIGWLAVDALDEYVGALGVQMEDAAAFSEDRHYAARLNRPHAW